MEKNELMLKLEELFKDEEYVKILCELETPGEVQASLAAKGVEIPAEDIEKFRELLVKSESGELSEENLESVVGGTHVFSVLWTISSKLAGAIVDSINKKRW